MSVDGSEIDEIATENLEVMQVESSTLVFSRTFAIVFKCFLPCLHQNHRSTNCPDEFVFVSEASPVAASPGCAEDELEVSTCSSACLHMSVVLLTQISEHNHSA